MSRTGADRSTNSLRGQIRNTSGRGGGGGSGSSKQQVRGNFHIDKQKKRQKKTSEREGGPFNPTGSALKTCMSGVEQSRGPVYTHLGSVLGLGMGHNKP